MSKYIYIYIERERERGRELVDIQLPTTVLLSSSFEPCTTHTSCSNNRYDEELAQAELLNQEVKARAGASNAMVRGARDLRKPSHATWKWGMRHGTEANRLTVCAVLCKAAWGNQWETCLRHLLRRHCYLNLSFKVMCCFHSFCIMHFVHLFIHSLAKQITGVCHCLYAA